MTVVFGGNPTYTPVDITGDPRFAFLKPTGFDEAFGVLAFDGGQEMFVLDGQHRLKAIKILVEQNQSDVPETPEGFLDEEIAVIMIVRREAKDAEVMASYRRKFPVSVPFSGIGPGAHPAGGAL